MFSVLILTIGMVGSGDWSWSGFSGYHAATEIPQPPKPSPPPEKPPDPPKTETPVVRPLIYRKDSRGFQCQSRSEAELDAFIKGRESVYLQQEAEQKKLQAQYQAQIQTQQYFTPIAQSQNGMMVCGANGCQMVPY